MARQFAGPFSFSVRPALDKAPTTSVARLTNREKLIAGRRAGITEILLPEDNGGELEEVPDHVHQGLKVHFYARSGDLLPCRFRQTETGKRGLR